MSNHMKLNIYQTYRDYTRYPCNGHWIGSFWLILLAPKTGGDARTRCLLHILFFHQKNLPRQWQETMWREGGGGNKAQRKNLDAVLPVCNIVEAPTYTKHQLLVLSPCFLHIFLLVFSNFQFIPSKFRSEKLGVHFIIQQSHSFSEIQYMVAWFVSIAIFRDLGNVTSRGMIYLCHVLRWYNVY